MALFSANPAPTVGLGYIVHQLGQSQSRSGREHGARWQVDYVRLLIEELAFPQPLPSYRGGRLLAHVNTHSRWSRLAVDQWFEDRLPPEAAAAEQDRQILTAANDMDEAAGEIAAAMRGRRLQIVGEEVFA